MYNFEIKIFNSFSEELKDCWLKFENKSSQHIFQSYEWQKLWYEKQQECKQPIINYTILIYENNELIMILPFNIRSCYSIKILSWSGFPFSDYNVPLIPDDKTIKIEDFNIIWKQILKIKKFDCIVFENQPENILAKKNPFFHFLDNKIDNKYFGIKLNKKFEIKKNELDNIKYQKNRLEKLGKLDFKIAQNFDDKKKVINFIIKHKIKQYVSTKAWNLFKYEFNENFFITSNLAMEEKAYISYITINDEIIAAHSGFIYKNTCYYLFPVYKEEYKKYSPGKILLKKIIDDSKSKSLQYFDLTIGSENYKKNYSNNELCSGIFLQSVSLKGYFYILHKKLKVTLKKILKG